MSCVCDRLASGKCYYCRNPRSIEERRAFIREGIGDSIRGKVVKTVTREQAFEEERKRLAKKGKKGRRKK